MFYTAVFISALSACAAADEEPLKCYQCRVERNEDCTDAYLRPCPNDQAYDVCMVSVTNNAGHVYIEKTCGLGPCGPRDPKQRDGLSLDQCARSQNSQSCYECCKESGCNTSSAYELRDPPSPLMLIVSLSLGLLAKFFSFGWPRPAAGRS